MNVQGRSARYIRSTGGGVVCVLSTVRCATGCGGRRDETMTSGPIRIGDSVEAAFRDRPNLARRLAKYARVHAGGDVGRFILQLVDSQFNRELFEQRHVSEMMLTNEGAKVGK